jgi:hypothetical protein
MSELAEDKILSTNDLLFKKTFAAEGNEDITSGLVYDFFGIKPEKLILKMPYSIESYLEMLKNNEIRKLRQTIKDLRASLITSDFIAEL